MGAQQEAQAAGYYNTYFKPGAQLLHPPGPKTLCPTCFYSEIPESTSLFLKNTIGSPGKALKVSIVAT